MARSADGVEVIAIGRWLAWGEVGGVVRLTREGPGVGWTCAEVGAARVSEAVGRMGFVGLGWASRAW